MTMFLEIHCEEKAEMSDDSSSDVEASSAQPTIKKGLSKYYNGKSQSFTSISEVTSVEDLAKKQLTPFRSFKFCKSYAQGTDDMSQMESPRVAANKGSRGSCASLAAKGGNRPPHIPIQKNF